MKERECSSAKRFKNFFGRVSKLTSTLQKVAIDGFAKEASIATAGLNWGVDGGYAHLVHAYLKKGDFEKAQAMVDLISNDSVRNQWWRRLVERCLASGAIDKACDLGLRVVWEGYLNTSLDRSRFFKRIVDEYLKRDLVKKAEKALRGFYWGGNYDDCCGDIRDKAVCAVARAHFKADRVAAARKLFMEKTYHHGSSFSYPRLYAELYGHEDLEEELEDGLEAAMMESDL